MTYCSFELSRTVEDSLHVPALLLFSDMAPISVDLGFEAAAAREAENKRSNVRCGAAFVFDGSVDSCNCSLSFVRRI